MATHSDCQGQWGNPGNNFMQRSQSAIPFLFMRGGTSRGPYFNRADLPVDRETLTSVLVSIVGSGNPVNIDGIGGGVAVTTKVAMLSPSEDSWADVDYWFAQVSVEDCRVDFKPTCGNILVGVGPAAIEMGLVPVTGSETEVRIHAVNTGAKIKAVVQTPDGSVNYDGATSVDGVPGKAAPVGLEFRDVVGGATGKLFPTGNRLDNINGIDVSCMDVAMPMVIARARDLGCDGCESADALQGNAELMKTIESIRLIAGERMGLGDVTNSVTPKFGLLAEASQGGDAATRYFMPWQCHPTLAVTGSQCMAACLLAEGTVGEGLMKKADNNQPTLFLEHPMGKLEVKLAYREENGEFFVDFTRLTRTARLIAEGSVYVPKRIWSP